MELTAETFFIICPLVFLAGVIDAIAGGGGLIALPAYLIAGVPTHLALGTNKMSSAIGTLISTIRYLRKSHIDLKVIAVSVIAALIGSASGSSLALLVDETILRYLLIIVLPVVAFFVLKNKSLGTKEQEELPWRKKYVLAIAIAFLIGTYDGFYGPGTGTFLLLLYVGIMKMDINTASATTKIVNLSSNTAAFIVFLFHGKVLILLGLIAAVFSVAGHYVGAGLVLKKGFRAVRPVMVCVLGMLLVKLIFFP